MLPKVCTLQPYLTFQKLISDGFEGEYLAESRTQTRCAIETLCPAAVVKLASAAQALPSPQELSQRKSFLPLPLTLLLALGCPLPPLPAAHLVGCLSRPFHLLSPPFQTLRRMRDNANGAHILVQGLMKRKIDGMRVNSRDSDCVRKFYQTTLFTIY